jgi:hypothetical protein
MMKSGKRGKRPSNYEVGWGRPPKHTRFQPGQSGNPKGRKRGSKNITAFLATELEGKVEVRQNGKVRLLTVAQAIVKRIIADALSGNFKAIAYLDGKAPEIERQLFPPSFRSEDLKKLSAQELSELYFNIAGSDKDI